jgi:hypothetical protein
VDSGESKRGCSGFVVTHKVPDRTPELDEWYEGPGKPAHKKQVNRRTVLRHTCYSCERGPEDLSVVSTDVPIQGERRSGVEHGDSFKVLSRLF